MERLLELGSLVCLGGFILSVVFVSPIVFVLGATLWLIALQITNITTNRDE